MSQNTRTTNRVLRTILANSNDVQGEWVSKRELYTHAVAHADLEASDVDQALHQLRQEGKIDVDEGRYRPASGVDQPKYPGES